MDMADMDIDMGHGHGTWDMMALLWNIDGTWLMGMGMPCATDAKIFQSHDTL